MQIDIRVPNARQVGKKLMRMGKEGQTLLGGELYREGEGIMTLSKQEYVPVEYAVLKDSGHVQLPKMSSRGVSVTLGFGGAASSYAVHVHERIFAPSGRLVHHPIGQAKYLEVPAMLRASGMGPRIVSNLHRAMMRWAMKGKG
jgi:hypothetical protein